MKRYQPIYDIAAICAQRGISQAVLCPGSRSAPLTIAFARHNGITTRTFSDERSAAFTAMGIAQQTSSPVAMVCTSGSAAYNFAPAIAEAFYSNTPLIVFTADRPAEWIDQQDGQAIRQDGIYGGHVKQSWTLPADYEHRGSTWHITRIINEAITLAETYPKGPVHINAPFREPFYPAAHEIISYSKDLHTVANTPGVQMLADDEATSLQSSLQGFDKILIIAGQGVYDDVLTKAVERFAKNQRAAVVGDIISNFHSLTSVVRLSDSFLAQGNDAVKKSLQPDLLITFGGSVISKHLKLFLRAYRPREHWHIQPAGVPADTFQGLSRILKTTPLNFFEQLYSAPKRPVKFEIQKRENYLTFWEAEEHKTARITENLFGESQLNELGLVAEIIRSLPARCNLHLANSMSVRYANFIGLATGRKGIHVFCNRGTSGIDGCSSTAVGHALASDVPNFLITGDLAFFYDRNAFWHNYPMANLRIVLLNNHGGIIFSMIDGPDQLPEQKEYFVTDQKLTAAALAAEFGFGYAKVDHIKKLKPALTDFMEFGGKTKILELISDQQLNKNTFNNFRNEIRKGYQ